MIKKLFFFGFTLLHFGLLQAQNRSVTGVVTDESGEEMPGVSVLLKGTSRGTFTDATGRYRLDDIPQTGTLIFSFTGYSKKEIAVNGQSEIDVSLEVNANQLEEVVVTSFNISKDKRELGYGSQSVKGEVLQNTADPNMVNALQGKLAGVTINTAGGAPGAGSNIVIRGINSLGGGANNQPLFIVDGIIISNDTYAGNVLPSAGSNAVNNAEQFSNTNRAADINPDDIASVNVLKGAAATALYGMRAANGAIIITTKRGVQGKSSVNYNASYGVESVSKVPQIQKEYYQGRDGYARSFFFYNFGPPNLPTDAVYNNLESFFRQGTRMNQSISVSGGNDKSTFYTSLSYFDQKGIVPNTKYGRVTARVSGETKFSRKLTVGGQLNYANSNSTSPASGDKSIYSSLSYWSNSADVNDYINPDGTEKDVAAGIIDNPRYFAETSPLLSKVNRVFGDIYANLALTDWLTARYQLTNDFYNDNRNRVVGADLDPGSQVRGYVVNESRNFSELNSNLLLTGVHQFSPEMNFSLTVGNNVAQTKSDNIWARGEGFNLPDFYDISNTTNFFTGKSVYLRRLVGVFGEAKLDYQNMLYLTLTGRNDWSSTLPVDNRSFFYPSASLSYILTESFLKDNNTISYAKLRASYAEIGKDAPAYYTDNYFGTVNGFPFGSVGGLERSIVAGNPNIVPERTKETEIGLEATLFKNRVTLETNYFVRNSDKQIFSIPISNVVGYASYATNAGLIRNRGVEVLLGIKPIKTKNFTWDMNFNWDRIRSKVISMPPGIEEITYYDQGRSALKIVQGGSMGDLYGYDWERNANGDVLIGENGQPTLDLSQYVKIGNALPDWKGGMLNTLRHKAWALSFLLEWKHGGDVVDLQEMNSLRNGLLDFTGQRDQYVIFKGVTADGSPNTKPYYLDQDTYRSFGYNAHYSFNIQDASWFRLRNVNLSYTIPAETFNNKIQGIRLSVAANNVFLSTPFRGYDPESLAFGSGSNLIGFTGRNTPATRSVIFGLNVNF